MMVYSTAVTNPSSSLFSSNSTLSIESVIPETEPDAKSSTSGKFKEQTSFSFTSDPSSQRIFIDSTASTFVFVGQSEQSCEHSCWMHTGHETSGQLMFCSMMTFPVMFSSENTMWNPVMEMIATTRKVRILELNLVNSTALVTFQARPFFVSGSSSFSNGSIVD